MGHVTEGLGLTYRTLAFGFEELSNKSALYFLALLISLVLAYVIFRAAFFCFKEDGIRNMFGMILMILSLGLIAFLLMKVIKDEAKLNFGSCWQADYFCIFLFLVILWPYVVFKYVTAGETSSAMTEFWKGTTIFVTAVLYALIFSPVYVWGVGQGEGVWDSVEDEKSIVIFAQTMTFMIIFIYFVMLMIWTKGHWISTMFPIVAFNGATMFYYEMFPMAIVNGLIANGVFIIYIVGDKVLGRAFDNARANTSMLVMLILAYYFILFAFWPAFSTYYGGGFTGHGYTEFDKNSFYH